MKTETLGKMIGCIFIAIVMILITLYVISELDDCKDMIDEYGRCRLSESGNECLKFCYPQESYFSSGLLSGDTCVCKETGG